MLKNRYQIEFSLIVLRKFAPSPLFQDIHKKRSVGFCIRVTHKDQPSSLFNITCIIRRYAAIGEKTNYSAKIFIIEVYF